MKHLNVLGIILSIFSFNTDVLANDIDIFTAAREGNSSAITKYVLQGVNVNLANSKRYTPFILTAYYGHIHTLGTLLHLGADPCAIDHKGSNAFMGVAFKGHMEIAKWLLKNTHCNVNHQNNAGQTALMMASLFGREEMINLLLEYKAKPSLKDHQGNTSVTLAQAQGLSRVVEIIQFHFQ